MTRLRDEDFSAFYAQSAEAVTRYALLLDRQSGGDLAAEAFARALQHWRRVSSHEYPEAWMRRTVLNLHISKLRRRRLEVLFRPRGSVESDFSPEATDRVVLAKALSTLSPRQRAALILRYYEGLTFDEVASVMECSPSTASKHVRRGLGKLRAIVDIGQETPSGPPQLSPSSSRTRASRE